MSPQTCVKLRDSSGGVVVLKALRPCVHLPKSKRGRSASIIECVVAQQSSYLCVPRRDPPAQHTGEAPLLSLCACVCDVCIFLWSVALLSSHPSGSTLQDQLISVPKQRENGLDHLATLADGTKSALLRVLGAPPTAETPPERSPGVLSRIGSWLSWGWSAPAPSGDEPAAQTQDPSETSPGAEAQETGRPAVGEPEDPNPDDTHLRSGRGGAGDASQALLQEQEVQEPTRDSRTSVKAGKRSKSSESEPRDHMGRKRSGRRRRRSHGDGGGTKATSPTNGTPESPATTSLATSPHSAWVESAFEEEHRSVQNRPANSPGAGKHEGKHDECELSDAEMEEDAIERRTESAESKRRSIKVSHSEKVFAKKVVVSQNEDLNAAGRDTDSKWQRVDERLRSQDRLDGPSVKSRSQKGGIADKISRFETGAVSSSTNLRHLDISPARNVSSRLREFGNAGARSSSAPPKQSVRERALNFSAGQREKFTSLPGCSKTANTETSASGGLEKSTAKTEIGRETKVKAKAQLNRDQTDSKSQNAPSESTTDSNIENRSKPHLNIGYKDSKSQDSTLTKSAPENTTDSTIEKRSKPHLNIGCKDSKCQDATSETDLITESRSKPHLNIGFKDSKSQGATSETVSNIEERSKPHLNIGCKDSKSQDATSETDSNIESRSKPHLNIGYKDSKSQDSTLTKSAPENTTDSTIEKRSKPHLNIGFKDSKSQGATSETVSNIEERSKPHLNIGCKDSKSQDATLTKSALSESTTDSNIEERSKPHLNIGFKDSKSQDATSETDSNIESRSKPHLNIGYKDSKSQDSTLTKSAPENTTDSTIEKRSKPHLNIGFKDSKSQGATSETVSNIEERSKPHLNIGCKDSKSQDATLTKSALSESTTDSNIEERSKPHLNIGFKDSKSQDATSETDSNIESRSKPHLNIGYKDSKSQDSTLTKSAPENTTDSTIEKRSKPHLNIGCKDSKCQDATSETDLITESRSKPHLNIGCKDSKSQGATSETDSNIEERSKPHLNIGCKDSKSQDATLTKSALSESTTDSNIEERSKPHLNIGFKDSKSQDATSETDSNIESRSKPHLNIGYKDSKSQDSTLTKSAPENTTDSTIEKRSKPHLNIGCKDSKCQDATSETDLITESRSKPHLNIGFKDSKSQGATSETDSNIEERSKPHLNIGFKDSKSQDATSETDSNIEERSKPHLNIGCKDSKSQDATSEIESNFGNKDVDNASCSSPVVSSPTDNTSQVKSPTRTSSRSKRRRNKDTTQLLSPTSKNKEVVEGKADNKNNTESIKPLTETKDMVKITDQSTSIKERGEEVTSKRPKVPEKLENAAEILQSTVKSSNMDSKRYIKSPHVDSERLKEVSASETPLETSRKVDSQTRNSSNEEKTERMEMDSKTQKHGNKKQPVLEISDGENRDGIVNTLFGKPDPSVTKEVKPASPEDLKEATAKDSFKAANSSTCEAMRNRARETDTPLLPEKDTTMCVREVENTPKSDPELDKGQRPLNHESQGKDCLTETKDNVTEATEQKKTNETHKLGNEVNTSKQNIHQGVSTKFGKSQDNVRTNDGRGEDKAIATSSNGKEIQNREKMFTPKDKGGTSGALATPNPALVESQNNEMDTIILEGGGPEKRVSPPQSQSESREERKTTSRKGDLQKLSSETKGEGGTNETTEKTSAVNGEIQLAETDKQSSVSLEKTLSCSNESSFPGIPLSNENLTLEKIELTSLSSIASEETKPVSNDETGSSDDKNTAPYGLADKKTINEMTTPTPASTDENTKSESGKTIDKSRSPQALFNETTSTLPASANKNSPSITQTISAALSSSDDVNEPSQVPTVEKDTTPSVSAKKDKAIGKTTSLPASSNEAASILPASTKEKTVHLDPTDEKTTRSLDSTNRTMPPQASNNEKTPLDLTNEITTYKEKATPPTASTKEKATPPATSTNEKTIRPTVSANEKATLPRALTNEKATPPTQSNNEKTTPPSASTNEKATPPKQSNNEKTTPPSASTNEKATPPTISTNEKATPTTASTKEKATPPATSTNEKTIRPTVSANEKATLPRALTNEKATPPTQSNNEKTTPPSASTNEKATPPTQSNNEKTTPPSASTNEKATPPTISTNEKATPTTALTNEKATSSNEEATPSTVSTNEKSTHPTVSTNEKTTPPTVSTNEKTTPTTALTNEKATSSNEEATPSTVSTNEKSTHPTVSTNEKTTPPTASTNEKTTPTTAFTNEKATPPTASTNEKTTPTTALTNEKATSSNEEATPSTVSTNEKSTHPTVSTNEKATPPTVSTNEKATPPTVSTNEKSTPPTVSTNEKSTPPTVSTNEKATPPTASTNEKTTPTTALTNEKATSFNEEATPSTVSTNEKATPPTVSTNKKVASSNKEATPPTASTNEKTTTSTASVNEKATPPKSSIQENATKNEITTSQPVSPFIPITSTNDEKPTTLSSLPTSDSNTKTSASPALENKKTSLPPTSAKEKSSDPATRKKEFIRKPLILPQIPSMPGSSSLNRDSPSSWLDVDLQRPIKKKPLIPVAKPKLSSSVSETNLNKSGEFDPDDFIANVKRLAMPFSLPQRKHNQHRLQAPSFAMPAIREDRFEKPFDPEEFTHGLRRRREFSLDLAPSLLSKSQDAESKEEEETKPKWTKPERSSILTRSLIFQRTRKESDKEEEEEGANETKAEPPKTTSRLERCSIVSMLRSPSRAKRLGFSRPTEGPSDEVVMLEEALVKNDQTGLQDDLKLTVDKGDTHKSESRSLVTDVNAHAKTKPTLDSTFKTTPPLDSTIKTMPPLDSTSKTTTSLDSTIKTMAPLDSSNKTSPPLDSTNKTTPPLDSTNKTTPPLDSTIKTTPPLDSTNKTTPSLDLSIKTTPHLDSTLKTTPPLDSTIKTTPPLDSTITTTPPLDSTIKTTPPLDSTITTTPPLDSTNETKPTLDSVFKTTPPLDSTNKTAPPLDLTNKTTPSLDLSNKTTPPLDSTLKTTPPLDSTITTTPPLDSTNETKPTLDSVFKTTPPLDSTNKTTPPLDSTNKTTPSLDLSNKTTPPLDSTLKTMPPLDSTITTTPPLDSTSETKPTLDSVFKTTPPLDSTNKTTPPLDSTNETKPTLDSTFKTTPPLNSSNKTTTSLDSTNKTTPPLDSTNKTKLTLDSTNKTVAGPSWTPGLSPDPPVIMTTDTSCSEAVLKPTEVDGPDVTMVTNTTAARETNTMVTGIQTGSDVTDGPTHELKSAAADKTTVATKTEANALPPLPSFDDIKLPSFLEKFLPKEPEVTPQQPSNKMDSLASTPAPADRRSPDSVIPAHIPQPHREFQNIPVSRGSHRRPGKIVIFEHHHFGGQAFEFYRDQPDATHMSLSRVVSVRSVRGCWILYEKPGFVGRCIALEEEGVAELPNQWAEEGEENAPVVIGSIRLAVRDYTPPRIELFTEPTGRGRSWEFVDLTEEVNNFSLHHNTGSIKVHSGLWMVYSDPGFQGLLAVLEAGEYPFPEDWGFPAPVVGSLRPLRMGLPKVERPHTLKAVLFEKADFQGRSVEVQEDVFSSSWTDDPENHGLIGVESLKILGGLWVGYEFEGFEGKQFVLEEGHYSDWSDWGGTSPKLLSLRPVFMDFSAPHMKLFSETGFSDRGVSLDVLEPLEDTTHTHHGPHTHSIDVLAGVWLAFEEPVFSGQQYVLEKGLYGSPEDWGATNGRISSVIPVTLENLEDSCHFQMELFSEPDFAGASVLLQDSLPMMPQGFSLRSCRVLAGSWQAFCGECFSAQQCVLEEGLYPDLRAMGFSQPDASVLSLQPIAHEFSVASIVLFERSGLRGRRSVLKTSSVNLQLTHTCSRVCSVLVEGGMWVLYEANNFRGAQVLLKPGVVPDWPKLSSWQRIGSLRPLMQKRMFFRLRNEESRLLMSVIGSLEDIKLMRIQAAEETGGVEQIWTYQDGLLQCKWLLDCCVDVGSSVLMSGSRAVLSSDFSKPQQLWNITSDGIIRNNSAPQLVLEVKGGQQFDKSQIILNDFHPNKPNQHWTLEIL